MGAGRCFPLPRKTAPARIQLAPLPLTSGRIPLVGSDGRVCHRATRCVDCQGHKGALGAPPADNEGIGDGGGTEQGAALAPRPGAMLAPEGAESRSVTRRKRPLPRLGRVAAPDRPGFAADGPVRAAARGPRGSGVLLDAERVLRQAALAALVIEAARFVVEAARPSATSARGKIGLDAAPAVQRIRGRQGGQGEGARKGVSSVFRCTAAACRERTAGRLPTGSRCRRRFCNTSRQPCT